MDQEDDILKSWQASLVGDCESCLAVPLRGNLSCRTAQVLVCVRSSLTFHSKRFHGDGLFLVSATAQIALFTLAKAIPLGYKG